MLTTLFNAIQTAVGSFTRAFLVVTYLPLVLFIALNGGLLKATSPTIARALFGSLKISTDTSMGLALWILGSSAAALLLGALQPTLYRITDGDLMPRWLCRRLHIAHQRRVDELRFLAAQAFDAQELFDRKSSEWLKRMTLPEHGGRVPSAEAMALINDMAKLRSAGDAISPEQIEAAVSALDPDLRAAGPDSPPSQLRDLRRRLLRLIGYMRDRSRYEYRQVQNILQASYPGGVFDPEPSSDNVLAPTTFGNIGRTMRSYALRRYGLDLDIFWNRLQKVMADDNSSKMFDGVQGLKTQVDFLINLLWLTVITGVFWIPILAIFGAGASLFAAVALGMPLLAAALYYLTCRAYVVFADQVRTAVDYFRFAILQGLKINPPNDTEDEELLWERLGNRIGYARKDATFLYGPKS
jgi:hypothetical protein